MSDEHYRNYDDESVENRDVWERFRRAHLDVLISTIFPGTRHSYFHQMWPDGRPVTDAEADYDYRICIRCRTPEALITSRFTVCKKCGYEWRLRKDTLEPWYTEPPKSALRRLFEMPFVLVSWVFGMGILLFVILVILALVFAVGFPLIDLIFDIRTK